MTLSVIDANGATQSIETLPTKGRASAAASLPAALSSEDLAALNSIITELGALASEGKLEAVRSLLAGTLAVQDGLNQPFQGAVAYVVGTAQTPKRAFCVIATAAGNVAVTLNDGSSFTFPVAVGLSVLPFAVKTVVATGTTATATYFNLV